MSSIDVMVSTPGDEASGKGLSALIHGLKEMDQVALVRYVPRKNASPQVGILYPVIHSTHECLYWAAIPFAEDVRYARSPSSMHAFNTARASSLLIWLWMMMDK
jgi:hypothetical protein